MISSDSPGKNNRNRLFRNGQNNSLNHKRILSIGKKSKAIIDELCIPIDAVNRFINLSLQEIEEGSQSREFLLESKRGIKQTSRLLQRLNNYAREIERELRDISIRNRKKEYIDRKQ